MLKCRSADRYRAILPPRCRFGGRPCDACRRKWATAQLAKIKRALDAVPYRRPDRRSVKVTPMHDGHLLAAMFNDSFGVIQ